MAVKRLEYRTKLLIAYIVWWVIWAIGPWDFHDWILENILPVLFIPLLIFTKDRFRLSSISYTTIFIFMCLHAIGSHYTYANVPYESWSASLGFSINDTFGFERNHFDRLVHFSFGLLLSYPALEMFARIADTRGAWSYYFPLEWVMSLSMLYELVEWYVAELFGGELGMAYLGTQGDIWDAHKDMGLATLGAAITVGITAFISWRYNRNFASEIRESMRVKHDQPLGEVKLRELKEKDGGPEDSDSQ